MYIGIGLLGISICIIARCIQNGRGHHIVEDYPESGKPCKRLASSLEERTQCALSELEQAILTDLEYRNATRFGEEVVLWQQLRWLVQHGMSPEHMEVK